MTNQPSFFMPEDSNAGIEKPPVQDLLRSIQPDPVPKAVEITPAQEENRQILAGMVDKLSTEQPDASLSQVTKQAIVMFQSQVELLNSLREISGKIDAFIAKYQTADDNSDPARTVNLVSKVVGKEKPDWRENLLQAAIDKQAGGKDDWRDKPEETKSPPKKETPKKPAAKAPAPDPIPAPRRVTIKLLTQVDGIGLAGQKLPAELDDELDANVESIDGSIQLVTKEQFTVVESDTPKWANIPTKALELSSGLIKKLEESGNPMVVNLVNGYKSKGIEYLTDIRGVKDKTAGSILEAVEKVVPGFFR